MVIKKLNTLFHKHSRWLFGIFAAVIIIAFMDFLTPGRGGCTFSGAPESQTAGTAFGKKVTFGDLMDIDRDIQIFESVIGGRSQREPKTLFYFYCVAERARQLGYTISDKQVAEFVKILPQFMGENGKFSQVKYDEFLKKQHITSAELVSALRKCMVIQQLPMFIAGNVSVSDNEIETVYRSNFPRIAINAFKVKGADFVKLVKIDDAALKKYMDANKQNYIIPGHMEVMAFELASAPFKGEAEKMVTADYVKKFIADNKITNGKPEVIRPLLVEQMAGDLAASRMNGFYRELLAAMDNAKNDADRAKIFREFAAQKKFTLVESKNVLFNGAGVGNIQSTELVKELRDSINPLSRPRRSNGGVAVAFMTKRVPTRPMTFAEAKVQLAKDYGAAEGVKLARIKAKELYSSIMKQSPAKRRDAFRKLGKMERITYSMLSAPENRPEHMAIISASLPALRTMKTGDISNVINCEDGALLVEMIQRVSAEMSSFAKHKENIRREIMESKSQQLTMEFMNFIERNCRYEAEDGNPAR